MSANDDKIEELESRVDKLDTSFAVMGEQIKNLVKSVDRLTHVVYAFTFLLLLAVIWGALGPDGFNAVTHTKNTVTNIHNYPLPACNDDDFAMFNTNNKQNKKG